MKTIQKAEPFFHNVYIGTAAERAALTIIYIHDQFYESDTGYMYQWGGIAWGQVSLNGVVNVNTVTTLLSTPEPKTLPVNTDNVTNVTNVTNAPNTPSTNTNTDTSFKTTVSNSTVNKKKDK